MIRRSENQFSARRHFVQFALAMLLVLALVVIATGWATTRLAVNQSLADAGVATAQIGESLVEPQLPVRAEIGTPEFFEAVDGLVRNRILSGTITHVRLWDPGGEILYSDRQELIGTRNPLDPAAHRALRTRMPESKVSDPEREKREGIPDAEPELEVYFRVQTADAQPLLFETYQPYGLVDAHARELFQTTIPLAVGAVLLLFTLQVPLTVALARRLHHSQSQEQAALRNAISAADAERRVIAADLHDGTIQDLAGVSLSLAVLADQKTVDSESSHATMRHAVETTRRAVRSLRSLLVDIYPPNLQEIGLQRALADLATKGSGQVEVAVLINQELSLSPTNTMLAYRIVRELLRNVHQHAKATRVEVTVSEAPGSLTIVVADDGIGMGPQSTAHKPGQASTHFGLRTLRDLVEAAGGEVRIGPTEPSGRGVTVTAEIPTQ